MKNLLLALLILTPITSFADIVNEIAMDFGYDRTIYGLNRQNSNVTRSYSAALSTYIFDYTAIDLTASQTSDTTTLNDQTKIGTTGYDRVNSQDRVTSNVYGIGIKQVFAPRSARLIPGISVGYARQFLKYNSDLLIENQTTKVREPIIGDQVKQRVDSVFGTFSLQLRLTDRLSLKGSVKTLIPAFKFDKARDNVKYSFGFSWVF